MRVRFRETLPSQHPAYPFQAGQVIDVSVPPTWLQAYLRDGRAEVVGAEDECSAVAAPEVAAARVSPSRTKRRR